MLGVGSRKGLAETFLASDAMALAGVTGSMAWALHKKCLIIDGHNDVTVLRMAKDKEGNRDIPLTWTARDNKYQTDLVEACRWLREGNRLDYKPVQMKPMSVDTIELKKRAY